jgi:hypothetical protein
MRWRSLAAALALSSALLAAPAASPAADAVYWTNSEGEPISFSNLDGSGAGNLALSGVISSMPSGLALDPADGKVFFTNIGTEGIFWAYLDGSGGGQINTAPVGIGEPIGIAVDRAAGRVYWSDPVNGRIGYANLDGSGGGAILNTAGATIKAPFGLALDRAAGRLYWVNFNTGLPKVSFANLDGSGGGDISKSAGPSNGTGVALDPRSGRVFWSVLTGTIESSALDGSGTTSLSLLGASPPESMRSIAIDIETNRAFWANGPSSPNISFANLSGGGGGDMSTAGANLNLPGGVAILRAPAATAPPSISGRATIKSILTCAVGGWADDAPASLFYRAPQTFVYRWLRNGEPINFADRQTWRPFTAGSYSCEVTARNFAGQATQTSAPFAVRSGIASAARVVRVDGPKAGVKLRCGPIPCEGRIQLRTRRGVALSGPKSFEIAAARERIRKVKLNKRGKELAARIGAKGVRARLTGVRVRPRRVLLLKLAKKKPKGTPPRVRVRCSFARIIRAKEQRSACGASRTSAARARGGRA